MVEKAVVLSEVVLFVRREQGYFVIIHTAFTPSFKAVLLLLID